MAQIQGLDANLEHAVDAYNLANQRLAGIESDLRTNKLELKLAKANLKHAQRQLNAHLIAMYTSGSQDTGLEVLLGATSMDDLLSRLDTMSRVSDQSTDVLRQVKVFRAKVKRRARAAPDGARAAGQARRRALGGESLDRGPARLAAAAPVLDQERDHPDQAAEQARQAQLAAQARTRLASTGATVLNASAGAISSSPQPAPVYAPPPSKYGGVVGIAMQYLGTPYVYGGASPGGFDCSGFVMYVFNQIGVSLPHNAAAQYGYGMPVSRDQLQAGDLVFFNGLGHVGIYIGGGQFIHSPHTGDVVKISSLSRLVRVTYVGRATPLAVELFQFRGEVLFADAALELERGRDLVLLR